MNTVRIQRPSPCRVSSRRFPVRAAAARRRGFTLLETLAAIAILTVAMSMLAQLGFQSLSQSIMTRRRAEGVLLAQAKMEEVIRHRSDLGGWLKEAAKDEPLDPETNTRRFAGADHDVFRWSCEFSDVKGSPGMKEVLVRTYWPRRGSKEWSRCELRTLLLAPAGGFHLFGEATDVSAEGRES